MTKSLPPFIHKKYIPKNGIWQVPNIQFCSSFVLFFPVKSSSFCQLLLQKWIVFLSNVYFSLIQKKAVGVEGRNLTFFQRITVVRGDWFCHISWLSHVCLTEIREFCCFLVLAFCLNKDILKMNFFPNFESCSTPKFSDMYENYKSVEGFLRIS